MNAAPTKVVGCRGAIHRAPGPLARQPGRQLPQRQAVSRTSRGVERGCSGETEQRGMAESSIVRRDNDPEERPPHTGDCSCSRQDKSEAEACRGRKKMPCSACLRQSRASSPWRRTSGCAIQLLALALLSNATSVVYEERRVKQRPYRGLELSGRTTEMRNSECGMRTGPWGTNYGVGRRTRECNVCSLTAAAAGPHRPSSRSAL